MKIATFNVNNINRRFDNLLAWLAAARPDVGCFQELRADQRDFPLRRSRKQATAPSDAASAVGTALQFSQKMQSPC